MVSVLGFDAMPGARRLHTLGRMGAVAIPTPLGPSRGMCLDDTHASSGATIRVFLLDDHHLIRRGMHELLSCERDFIVVGEADCAAGAPRAIAESRPDVALLDVKLLDGSGIDVCRQVKAEHPDILCVMLTSYETEQDVLDSILAGASAYLLKQMPGNQIVDALRRVTHGQALIDPAVTGKLLERLRKGAPGDERLLRLTSQERLILGLLGEALTNRQVAERIHLSEKTVKNYVSNILLKLGMEHRTQAALFAAGVIKDWAPTG